MRSRLSVFTALVVLGGETWAVGRVQAGICPEFKGGGVGLILKLNMEFYIDFEHSHHINFYFLAVATSMCYLPQILCYLDGDLVEQPASSSTAPLG